MAINCQQWLNLLEWAIPCGKIKLPLSSNWNAFSYLNALCSRDLHTAQSNGTTGSGAWIPALFCFPSQIKINSTSNYNCQWNNFSITKKFQKFLSQFHRITIYKNNKPNANESCYFLGHWIDRFFRFKRRYWLHRCWWRTLETKCVGDYFRMSVTVSAILVTNIRYLSKDVTKIGILLPTS